MIPHRTSKKKGPRRGPPSFGSAGWNQNVPDSEAA